MPSGEDSADEDTGRSLRLTQVLQQLRGLAVPGAIWERDVLPARVPDYEPHLLAEKCHSGELMWLAEGGRDPRRARVRFFFRGEGALFIERTPSDDAVAELGESARSSYDFLREEGAALLADIVDATGLKAAAARDALAELVLSGLATNDTLEAMRAVLGHAAPVAADGKPFSTLEAQLAELMPNRQPQRTHSRMRDARRHAREIVGLNTRSPRPTWVGRWSLAHRVGLLGRPLSEDELVMRRARQLLARWGVVTRACLERESPLFDWQALSDLLSRLEMRGEVRRGYFVEGLPGLQFALPGGRGRVASLPMPSTRAIRRARRGGSRRPQRGGPGPDLRYGGVRRATPLPAGREHGHMPLARRPGGRRGGQRREHQLGSGPPGHRAGAAGSRPLVAAPSRRHGCASSAGTASRCSRVRACRSWKRPASSASTAAWPGCGSTHHPTGHDRSPP